MSEKIKAFLQKPDKTRIIVIMGIVGIALIALSSVLFKDKSQDSTATNAAAETISQEQYVENTQQKITDIISKIQGAGDVEVMITLDKSSESQYVYEEKTSSDVTDGDTTKSKETSEKKYILVDDGNGGKVALVQSTVEPTIKGVLIVCDGGDNKIVENEILTAVTTLLDISSNRVHITKKGS